MGVGQTFSRMLGYCHKDAAMPHFKNMNDGITQHEIDIGVEEHQSLKLNFCDDKIMLQKASVFNRAHTFAINNPTATVGTFAGTVARMINSKKFMLSANLFMTSSGQMRKTSADAYWATIMDEPCTEEMVEDMLYQPVPGAQRYRYYDSFQTPTTIPRTTGTIDDDFVPLEPAQRDTILREAGLINSAGAGGSTDPIILPNDDCFDTGWDKIKKTIGSFSARRKRVIPDSDSESGEDIDDEEEEDDEELTAADAEFIDDRDDDDLSVAGSEE